MTGKELTTAEWKRADALAKELARDVDRNEVGKVITYMRRVQDPNKVQTLLQRLPRSSFVRTQRTRGYLERIGRAWHRHLQGLPKERALLVASWSFRLMTYYQDKKPGYRKHHR